MFTAVSLKASISDSMEVCGLQVLEGPMNAERYIKPCIFQQDNAKPLQLLLQSCRRVQELNWPVLRPVEASICVLNSKSSQFKHLLCFLCSIVTKILAHIF